MFEPDGLGTSAFFWFLGLISLLAIALLGHRIGGKSWKHGLARASSVAASALCLVLGAVSSLNHTYGWYTSWSDLASTVTGSHPAPIQHTFGAAPSTARNYDQNAAQRINAQANAQYATQRQEFTKRMRLLPHAPEGQWIKVNIPGQGVKGRDVGRVMVWLPPGYSANAHRSYPVIEAFHGMPGGTLDYKRVFFLDNVVRTAHAHHEMADAVIIVPQEMPNGIDTECVDGGGINEETWLTKTVPDFVIRNLYVQADSHSWATLGVSAGGWCSMMAGLLHPERYAAMASLGGYFSPDFTEGWNPFSGGKLPARYDLFKQAKEHPTHQSIWLLISGGDKLSGTTSAKFAKVLRPPDALTAVDYPGAGHRVDVWQRALPDVVNWLGKTLPAFSPTASQNYPASSTPHDSSTPAPSGSPASSAPATVRPHRHVHNPIRHHPRGL